MRGSPTSHAGILARALGVPAIFGIDGLETQALDGREIIIDGYRGDVLVEPAAAVHAHYKDRLREEEARLRRWRSLSKQPAATRDGHRVPLMVNVGSSLDASDELDARADGVGLFRTEVPFMLSERFLSEEEQTGLYRKVLKAMKGKPVMIRTLDIGGDKQLPYFPIEDPNPFLGWRGIRVSLDHPELFLVQIRAMLKANRGLANLHIVLPMVSQTDEFLECRDLIRQAHQELLAEDRKIGDLPPVGLVVEVPSSIFQIRTLARHADFVSIGTNDLTQYLLAVDRGNERVAQGFDALHPAVLNAVREVVRGAHREQCPVHVCGEMAGDVMGAALLVGLGVDGLSMSHPSLGRVRELLAGLTLSQAQAWARSARGLDSGAEVRLWLTREFAKYRLGYLLSGVEARR
jgi:phosphotransferase system enzyme I (PtsP)